MRVLFLSAWFPHPPSNGSRSRVRHLLSALAARHEVALLSFADRADVDPTAPALRGLCRSVQVFPQSAFHPDGALSRLAWLSPRPRSLVATHSASMAAAVARAAPRCDVVVASQLACAAYAPWFGDVPALFEEVELGALHDQLTSPAPVRRWRARLMWAKHRHYVRRLMRRFRACTVVSEPERRLLEAVLGDGRAIHSLPNGVTLGGDLPAPEADTLVFTGSLGYRPNYEAMRWFVAEVWPCILRARPAARLLITGDHGDLRLPPAERVERTGLVDDVRPLLGAAWLSVAPIFAGGGTRVKILDAMAVGTPVVSTSKAAEGIEARAGEHLLIADDAATFAASVLDVLSNPSLRLRLSINGRRLVEERHDWRVLGPRFETLVRSIA